MSTGIIVFALVASLVAAAFAGQAHRTARKALTTVEALRLPALQAIEEALDAQIGGRDPLPAAVRRLSPKQVLTLLSRAQASSWRSVQRHSNPVSVRSWTGADREIYAEVRPNEWEVTFRLNGKQVRSVSGSAENRQAGQVLADEVMLDLIVREGLLVTRG